MNSPTYSIEARDVWIKFDIQFVHHEVSLRRYLIQKIGELRGRGAAQDARPQETQGRDRRAFWALRGIDLRVEPGEVVGLIGPNGAGKSTFLMTMAGIYNPDGGSITVRGKVGTLLSLGGGFDQELTGVENIEQAGIFLGLGRDYIARNTDRIIEMADIGEFIHAPLRTYSSGMRTRLGFAIATHVNPDIILLDEVLETGDQAFRQKSGNLMEIFREQGKTLVIASHNMAMLNRYCSRVVWLERGRIAAEGPAQEITSRYQEAMAPRAAARAE